MILTIYIIILSCFLLGGIAFYVIDRQTDRETARNNRIKYITYFFIIHLLLLSIVFETMVFQFISIGIVMTGIGELIHVFWKSGCQKKTFFVFSLVIFLALSVGFIFFGFQSKGLILFTFLVLSLFDAFSQISGQLFGKTRIIPSISPNKTLEGLAGGVLFAVAGSLLLKDIIGMQTLEGLLLTTGIVLFAFLGDMAMSAYKRNYGVKDFSKLLPGHGGFLDRFDSLLAGGTFAVLFEVVLF